MHACGHDGHTAIGLAVAERLANPAAGWSGTLKLIFQPAEEGGRGAKPMVAAGVVDDVDYLFAGHLGCNLPSGKLAARATGFLFSRKIDVVFLGRAAHAAMGPHEGRNALLAAAAAALGLHGIARHAQEQTHVNVGKLVGRHRAQHHRRPRRDDDRGARRLAGVARLHDGACHAGAAKAPPRCRA